MLGYLCRCSVVIIEGEVSLIMGESIQGSRNRFGQRTGRGATGRQALVIINNKIRIPDLCVSV